MQTANLSLSQVVLDLWPHLGPRISMAKQGRELLSDFRPLLALIVQEIDEVVKRITWSLSESGSLVDFSHWKVAKGGIT